MITRGWTSLERQEAPRGTETACGEEIMMSCRGLRIKHLASFCLAGIKSQAFSSMGWPINYQTPRVSAAGQRTQSLTHLRVLINNANLALHLLLCFDCNGLLAVMPVTLSPLSTRGRDATPSSTTKTSSFVAERDRSAIVSITPPARSVFPHRSGVDVAGKVWEFRR